MWTECLRITTYHSFLTVLPISHKWPMIAWSFANRSLKNLLLNISPIALWYGEALLSNFLLAWKAATLKPTSNISFPYPFLFSVQEPSKILLTKYPPRWPCRPNPPNVMLHLWSQERPPCPHNTPQRKNGPSYHFILGLILACYLSAHHYENPPQVLIYLYHFDSLFTWWEST